MENSHPERFPRRQVTLRPLVSRSFSPPYPNTLTLSPVTPMCTNTRSNFSPLSLADKLSSEVKKCGVTKTISPPTIKQEPAEETSQPMLPDSSSDRGSSSSLKRPISHVARVKMEHLEVKQEPGTWDGEVSNEYPSKFQIQIPIQIPNTYTLWAETIAVHGNIMVNIWPALEKL